jgi:hypothetical protein
LAVVVPALSIELLCTSASAPLCCLPARTRLLLLPLVELFLTLWLLVATTTALAALFQTANTLVINPRVCCRWLRASDALLSLFRREMATAGLKEPRIM